MRSILLVIIVAVGAGSLVAQDASPAKRTSENSGSNQDAVSTRPNFVVFIADDLGWNDLGCYGHPSIRTPSIDALAASGLRFDRAYLTCSSCSPSRCSILTSRYPHATGAGELHMPLPAEQTLVTTPLREAGYWTVASGKWHLGRAARDQFDSITQNGGPSGAGQWLQALESRPKDQPFFAWLAAYDPHRGYQPGTLDPPHTRDDVVVPEIFPDTRVVRDDLAMYYDEIGRFDTNVGRVVSMLQRDGLLENTFVVVMSDNGRPWPHCKTRVNVDGTRTPFIVHWPAGLHTQGTTDSLISSIDLAATMLDLAEVDRPTSFQGISFASILDGSDQPVRRFAFAEHNWHDYRARERAVYTQSHALIVNSLPHLPATPPADAVRSPTYRQMIEMNQRGELSTAAADVFLMPRARELLHDVRADPHCLINLIESPEQSARVSAMRAALDAFADLTHDHFSGNAEQLTPDGFDRQTGRRLQPAAKTLP